MLLQKLIAPALLEALHAQHEFCYYCLRLIKLNLRRQPLPIALVKAESLLEPSSFGLVLGMFCIKQVPLQFTLKVSSIKASVNGTSRAFCIACRFCTNSSTPPNGSLDFNFLSHSQPWFQLNKTQPCQ